MTQGTQAKLENTAVIGTNINFRGKTCFLPFIFLGKKGGYFFHGERGVVKLRGSGTARRNVRSSEK